MFSRLHWEKFGIHRKKFSKKRILGHFENSRRSNIKIVPISIAILVPLASQI